jgi:hypothetical protein
MTHPHGRLAAGELPHVGDHLRAIMDRSDGRAEGGVARSGRIIGAGGGGSGTRHPVVAGRLSVVRFVACPKSAAITGNGTPERAIHVAEVCRSVCGLEPRSRSADAAPASACCVSKR